MRRGDSTAWRAYHSRFGPPIEAYARRLGIPTIDWPVCVSEVLDDEAIRLTRSAVAPPRNLVAYLSTAVRNRYLRLKRAELCRQRNSEDASEDCRGEWVVTSLCSEYALRSGGLDTQRLSTDSPLRRLAIELRNHLRPEEEIMLAWVSERVPHSEIAQWLGISHSACAKRVWRLCRRLRARAVASRAACSHAEQIEIDRFLRRANRSSGRHRLSTKRRLANDAVAKAAANKRRGATRRNPQWSNGQAR